MIVQRTLVTDGVSAAQGGSVLVAGAKILLMYRMCLPGDLALALDPEEVSDDYEASFAILEKSSSLRVDGRDASCDGEHVHECPGFKLQLVYLELFGQLHELAWILHRFLTRSMSWWDSASMPTVSEFIEHVFVRKVRMFAFGPLAERDTLACDLVVDAPCSSSFHAGQRRSLRRTRVVLSNPLQGSARRFLLRHKFCRWLSVLDMIISLCFSELTFGIDCAIKITIIIFIFWLKTW